MILRRFLPYIQLILLIGGKSRKYPCLIYLVCIVPVGVCTFRQGTVCFRLYHTSRRVVWICVNLCIPETVWQFYGFFLIIYVKVTERNLRRFLQGGKRYFLYHGQVACGIFQHHIDRMLLPGGKPCDSKGIRRTARNVSDTAFPCAALRARHDFLCTRRCAGIRHNPVCLSSLRRSKGNIRPLLRAVCGAYVSAKLRAACVKSDCNRLPPALISRIVCRLHIVCMGTVRVYRYRKCFAVYRRGFGQSRYRLLWAAFPVLPLDFGNAAGSDMISAVLIIRHGHSDVKGLTVPAVRIRLRGIRQCKVNDRRIILRYDLSAGRRQADLHGVARLVLGNQSDRPAKFRMEGNLIITFFCVQRSALPRTAVRRRLVSHFLYARRRVGNVPCRYFDTHALFSDDPVPQILCAVFHRHLRKVYDRLRFIQLIRKLCLVNIPCAVLDIDGLSPAVLPCLL